MKAEKIRQRGAPYSWCARQRIYTVHIRIEGNGINTCDWNVHVLIRINRNTHAYRKFDHSLLRLIASKLVKLIKRSRVRSLVVMDVSKRSIEELNSTV